MFCDASQLAYSAVIYIKTSNDKENSNFVFGRAKVAPLKQISILKLELQAAVLGCRLWQFFTQHLSVPIKETIFWSDRTAVLGWINSKEKFKTFIANHVQEIRNLTGTSCWRHIIDKINPADHISRGILPEDVNSWWLSPPEFLKHSAKNWNSFFAPQEATHSMQQTSALEPVFNIEKFSKWPRLLRATARVLLSMDNLKTKERRALALEDIDKTRNHLFQVSQLNSFSGTVKDLINGKDLQKKDRLLCLSLFVKDGILRVGSRTKRSSLPFEATHPIILDSKEAIVKLFIQKCYEICMHLGVEYTRNYIQQRCHIIRVRESLRSLAFKCFECQKFRAVGLQPPMADLPEVRFQDSSLPAVFTNVGLDYLGPFAVMHRDKEVKTYICLFTCLLTRAIHLEKAEDLSTDKCILAIRRFTSRGGQPRVLMSDNATNFLGFRKQLRRKPLQLDHDSIKCNLLNQSIEWILNPPSAPHFGGVWERLVQIFKRVLLINLGSAKLTPDVFSTIVTEAECLVNSRPLTHVRSDNKDDDPLTPNHFLLGRPFANVPTLLFQESASLKSTSWTQVKQRLQQIWKRLLQEYVPTLNQRQKWTSKEAALEVDDVVWLLEEWTPRGIWPLGRFTRIFTGPDKTARSCELKTALGSLTNQPLSCNMCTPNP